jgi:hypothetical protein
VRKFSVSFIPDHHEDFKMLLAPITVNQSNPEDIEMARLFRNALQARMKRRYSVANVINLNLHRAKTQPAAADDYSALFEVPMFNLVAA